MILNFLKFITVLHVILHSASLKHYGNNQEALQVRQDAHANNPASYHNAKRGFQLDTHSKEPWQYFPLKSLNQKHIYNNYQPVLNDERRSNGAERNKNDLQVKFSKNHQPVRQSLLTDLPSNYFKNDTLLKKDIILSEIQDHGLLGIDQFISIPIVKNLSNIISTVTPSNNLVKEKTHHMINLDDHFNNSEQLKVNPQINNSYEITGKNNMETEISHNLPTFLINGKVHNFTNSLITSSASNILGTIMIDNQDMNSFDNLSTQNINESSIIGNEAKNYNVLSNNVSNELNHINFIKDKYNDTFFRVYNNNTSIIGNVMNDRNLLPKNSQEFLHIMNTDFSNNISTNTNSQSQQFSPMLRALNNFKMNLIAQHKTALENIRRAQLKQIIESQKKQVKKSNKTKIVSGKNHGKKVSPGTTKKRKNSGKRNSQIKKNQNITSKTTSNFARNKYEQTSDRRLLSHKNRKEAYINAIDKSGSSDTIINEGNKEKDLVDVHKIDENLPALVKTDSDIQLTQRENISNWESHIDITNDKLFTRNANKTATKDPKPIGNFMPNMEVFYKGTPIIKSSDNLLKQHNVSTEQDVSFLDEFSHEVDNDHKERQVLYSKQALKQRKKRNTRFTNVASENIENKQADINKDQDFTLWGIMTYLLDTNNTKPVVQKTKVNNTNERKEQIHKLNYDTISSKDAINSKIHNISQQIQRKRTPTPSHQDQVQNGKPNRPISSDTDIFQDDLNMQGSYLFNAYSNDMIFREPSQPTKSREFKTTNENQTLHQILRTIGLDKNGTNDNKMKLINKLNNSTKENELPINDMTPIQNISDAENGINILKYDDLSFSRFKNSEIKKHTKQENTSDPVRINSNLENSFENDASNLNDDKDVNLEVFLNASSIANDTFVKNAALVNHKNLDYINFGDLKPPCINNINLDLQTSNNNSREVKELGYTNEDIYNAGMKNNKLVTLYKDFEFIKNIHNTIRNLKAVRNLKFSSKKNDVSSENTGKKIHEDGSTKLIINSQLKYYANELGDLWPLVLNESLDANNFEYKENETNPDTKPGERVSPFLSSILNTDMYITKIQKLDD